MLFILVTAFATSVSKYFSHVCVLLFELFAADTRQVCSLTCCLVQTGTPGRQPHSLRKTSTLGAAKQASDTKRDQDVTRAMHVADSLASHPTGLTGSATDNEACFNMVNFILGAGVLGYPFCYKACGLVLTTVLVLICLIAAQLSMRLLLMSSQLSGKKTYEELARLSFGRTGQRVMGTCVFMLNLGALVAYVNILADVLSSVAGSVIPPGAEPSRNIIMTGAMQRSPPRLSAAS